MAELDDQQKVIKKIIQLFGTQKKLADALGVQQGHISIWMNRDKKIPFNRVDDIIKVCGGKFDKYDLRPDVYGERPSPVSLFKEGFRLLFLSQNLKKGAKYLSYLAAIIGLGAGMYFASEYLPEAKEKVLDLPNDCITCKIQDACLIMQ